MCPSTTTAGWRSWSTSSPLTGLRWPPPSARSSWEPHSRPVSATWPPRPVPQSALQVSPEREFSPKRPRRGEQLMLWRRRDRDEEVVERRSDRAWGGPPLVRGLFTLLGVVAAGFLIWLATLFDLDATGEFWAAMGILAAAGFVLGISQLLGGWTKWGLPVVSPGVFLFGFLPALILGGGVLLATRDTGQGTRDTVSGWAQDLGIETFVQDMSLFQGAIALGIGLVFSFVFDTAGPRRVYA